MKLFWRHTRRYIRHKVWQIKRLTRKWRSVFFSFVGATLVALIAMLFAHMAEWALEQNTKWVKAYPWFAWLALPLGLPIIAWLTRNFAPYTSGSGIPQVIASLAVPYGKPKKRAVGFRESLYKIPLTLLGMLAGASIGREGPSVQVGAAMMASFGRWCKKRNLAFMGLQENDLLVAGAAGGLAAAFNAPLAGVIFAIEELGRGMMLRWERQIFFGILAAGFVQVAMNGNNPYFYGVQIIALKNMVMWVMIGAVICGIAGGLFAKTLYKGASWVLPQKYKNWTTKHPLLLAAIMGLLVATLGAMSNGDIFGTGYTQVSAALHNGYNAPFGVAIMKWLATVFSYWAGIPGGIFTPCLTIGGMLGQHIADIAHLGLSSNILVLICMTAFLSAATQSPLTASVVVMEMTGSQNMLIWLLLGALVATVISRQFCPKPFYHAAAGRFKQRILDDCKQSNTV